MEVVGRFLSAVSVSQGCSELRRLRRCSALRRRHRSSVLHHPHRPSVRHHPLRHSVLRRPLRHSVLHRPLRHSELRRRRRLILVSVRRSSLLHSRSSSSNNNNSNRLHCFSNRALAVLAFRLRLQHRSPLHFLSQRHCPSPMLSSQLKWLLWLLYLSLSPIAIFRFASCESLFYLC